MASKMVRGTNSLVVIALSALIIAVCVQDCGAQASTSGTTAMGSVSTEAGSTESTDTSAAPMSDSPSTTEGTIEPSGSTGGVTSMTEAPDGGGSPNGTESSSTTLGDRDGVSTLTSGMQESTVGETQNPNTGGTAPAVIECYSCMAQNKTDPCYLEQKAGNKIETCGVGERCWTIRNSQAGSLVNVTRGCRADQCHKTHGSAEDQLCEEMQDIEVCSQCCEKTLCNKHVNVAGMGPSVCLGGVVVAVMAALSLIRQ